MTLVDIIDNIEKVDDGLIIFIENINRYDADIILAESEVGDEGVKTLNYKKYYYLLEIFLAKEFLAELEKTSPFLSNADLARRLFEYSINDA
jgi:hypothetical protein